MFSHRRSCSYLMGNYYFCNNCIIAHCFLNFFAFLELSQNFKLVLFGMKKRRRGSIPISESSISFSAGICFSFPFALVLQARTICKLKHESFTFLLFFLGYSKLPILTLFFLLLLRVIVSQLGCNRCRGYIQYFLSCHGYLNQGKKIRPQSDLLRGFCFVVSVHSI